jgi:hypothetical protein
MTITDTRPATPGTDLDAPPASITANAAELIRAVQNVALFASRDDTWPVICTVRLTAADGTLTADATDRYVLGQEMLDAEGTAEMLVDAAGAVDAVKTLAKVLKASGAGRMPLAVPPKITVTGEGDYARFTLTGHVGPDASASALLRHGEFPQTSRLWPADEDGHAENCTGHAAFTAANLARLAKVTDGDGRPGYLAVRFAFSTPLKPAVVRIGSAFRALVMPIKVG